MAKGDGVDPRDFEPRWQPPAEGFLIVLSAIPGLTSRAVLKREFVFQHPPLDDLTVDGAVSWADSETYGAGTVSRPGGRGLRSVQFSSLFLSYDFWSWLPQRGDEAVQPIDPTRAVAELRAVMNARTPFQLDVFDVVSRGVEVQSVGQGRTRGPLLRTELSMAATLRGVASSVRAGEPDARYFAAQFVEYQRAQIEVRRQRATKGTAESKRLPARLEIAKLPDSRDSLMELARYYYGDASRWRLIWRANPWLKGQGLGPRESMKTDLKKAVLKSHPRILVPRTQVATMEATTTTDTLEDQAADFGDSLWSGG